MKIDNLTVDRSNTSEIAIPRQGSRQVEKNSQQQNLVSMKSQVLNQMKEKQTERTKDLDLGIKELEEAIDQANKSFKPMNRRFEYDIHEVLQRVSVKVIDSDTDEIIREIPPEKLLDMMANMLEMAGIIVDERA